MTLRDLAIWIPTVALLSFLAWALTAGVDRFQVAILSVIEVLQ